MPLSRSRRPRERQEVGRDERLRPELREHLHDELEDLLTFGGVGARAQLVEDHHRRGRKLLEQLANADELGAEPPLGLVCLLLLDERHHEPAGARELGLARRHEAATLREQLRKRDRLEQAGLAARVRPGHQHGHVVAIGVELARHRLHAMGEQQRVEEALELARRPRLDERRQADREAGRLRRVVEAERSEVELEVAEQLHERRQLVLDPGEHGVDQPGHHLAFAELVPPNEQLDLREPAPERRAHEGVVLVFADLEHLERANTPVGADADIQREVREAVVVLEQVAEGAIGLPAPDAAAERRQPREPRARGDEAVGAQIDDGLERLQDVELPAVGLATAPEGPLEQRPQAADGRVQPLGRAAQRRRREQLREDRAPVLDDRPV
jgi:hypothetical protein